jgi:hypothetical protein
MKENEPRYGLTRCKSFTKRILHRNAQTCQTPQAIVRILKMTVKRIGMDFSSSRACFCFMGREQRCQPPLDSSSPIFSVFPCNVKTVH